MFPEKRLLTINLYVAKVSPSSSFSWTKLALLSLYYQPASHPPGIVSNMASDVNQSIQIRFTKLKMEDDINFL